MSARGDRAKRWIHFSVSVLLVGGIMVMANLLSTKAFFRLDLTRTKRFELSEATLKHLGALDQEVTIHLMPMARQGVDERRPRFYQRLQSMLGEYAKRCDKVRLVVVEPPVTEDVNQELTELFKNPIPEVVYFSTPGPEGEPRTAMLTFNQLYNANDIGSKVIHFRAEMFVTTMIRNLVRTEINRVYYTTGHQEPSPEDQRTPLGWAYLAQELQTREGVEFKSLKLLEEKSVPDDCTTLMILAPNRPFQDVEIAKIASFLERGGSLFYAPWPGSRTGIEELLEAWGVRIGGYRVVDPRNKFNPFEVVVTNFGEGGHPVNMGMFGLQFPMQDVVVVEEPPEKDSGILFFPLMKSSERAWEEQQPFNARKLPEKDPVERQGPFTLAASVVALVRQFPERQRDEARIIVVGAFAPFGNQRVMSPVGNVTIEYVRNMLRWLIGQEEPVRLEPARIEIRPYQPDPDTHFWVTLANWLGFPLLGVILGLVVFFFRRK